MADQAFQPHTPSFGDEEFDIGSIGLMNCAPHDEVHHQQHQQHHPQQQHVLYGSSTQMLTHLSHPQDPAALYGNPHPMYLHQQQQQQLGPPQNQDNGYVLHTLENSMNTWSPARNLQPSVPSPLDPHAATSPPSGDTSEESCDDSTSVVHAPGTKRPSPEPNDVAEATGRGAAKKPKPQQQKKKKRRDPHEPQKPVSAYALFFRDTQAAIKGQNPNASFGEVSKIVASMWDALDAESKNIYKRKTEAAKKEYLKALAAYRASVVSKGGNGNATNDAVFPSATPPHQNSTFANYQPNYNLGQPYNSTATVQQPPQSPLTKKTPLLTSLMKEQQQQQQQQSYSIAKPYATQQQPQQIMMHATAQHIQHPAVQQMTNYPQHLQQQQQQQQQHLANVGQSQQGHVSHSMNLNGKHNGPGNLHNQLCIRAGCPNAAVQTSDWENEYCSNEDVFSAWVAANPNGPPGYPAPVK